MNHGITFGAAALLAGFLPPQLLPAQEVNYALLIGVANYQQDSGLSQLQYPDADVSVLRDVLVDRPGATERRYERDNVFVLSTAEGQTRALTDGMGDPYYPNKANIRARLDELLDKVDEDDSLLVYFSGHGIQVKQEGKPDAEFYLCPIDAERNVPETLLLLDELYKKLEQCRARAVFLICDACRTELAKGPNVNLGAFGRPALPSPRKGIAVFFSCSKNQASLEIPQLKHGLFTHYLLEGLRYIDAPPADEDGDGLVEVDELFKHVSIRVQDYAKLRGFNQRPEIMIQSDLIEFPLVSVPAIWLPHDVGFRYERAPHSKHVEFGKEKFFDRIVRRFPNGPTVEFAFAPAPGPGFTPFYIMTEPVSHDLFDRFVAGRNLQNDWRLAAWRNLRRVAPNQNDPAVCVPANLAWEFARWLGGPMGDLPMKDQWEAALSAQTFRVGEGYEWTCTYRLGAPAQVGANPFAGANHNSFVYCMGEGEPAGRVPIKTYRNVGFRTVIGIPVAVKRR